MVVFISFCSLILGVIALLNANKNRATPDILSALAIILSFISVAFARPRSGSTLSIDYLGIIVSILGIMTTILLGYQLYNAFKIKEETDKVVSIKKDIKKFTSRAKTQLKENEKQKDQINAKLSELDVKITTMNKGIEELKQKRPDLHCWEEFE